MKWYQGQISKRVHAFMKAEAQIRDLTIPEYINQLVVSDLEKKGYAINKNKEVESSGESARSRLPKKPGALSGEAAGIFAFFDKEIRPLDEKEPYMDRLQVWIQESGPALVMQVLKDAIDENENPNYPPLPFVEEVMGRIKEKGIKSVYEYTEAKNFKKSVTT